MFKIGVPFKSSREEMLFFVDVLEQFHPIPKSPTPIFGGRLILIHHLTILYTIISSSEMSIQDKCHEYNRIK